MTSFQQISVGFGKCERSHKIETVMMLSIRCNIFHRSYEEPLRRRQALPMYRMIGLGILKLEMNKASCQLNQSFREIIIRSIPTIFEPEMLQHIMSLVVLLRIKTLKIPQIAAVKAYSLIQVQRPNESIDSI